MMMFWEKKWELKTAKKGHTNHSEKSGKIFGFVVEKWKSVSQFAEGEQKKQFYKESLFWRVWSN